MGECTENEGLVVVGAFKRHYHGESTIGKNTGIPAGMLGWWLREGDGEIATVHAYCRLRVP